MGIDRPGDPVALLDDDATGGLGLAIWGFATVVAVVLGFASWQYAPPRAVESDVARLGAQPSSEDVTGSIVVAEPGASAALPARVVGGGRFAPMTLTAGDTPATTRDVEQLRADLRDLQRRIAQMGLSGDGVSRRLDRLEARLTTLAATVPPAATNETKAVRVVAAEPAPSQAAPASPPQAPRAEAGAPVAAEAGATPPPEVAASAETVKLPLPRPELDPPIVTGSLPPKPVATAKTDRQSTSARPTVETVPVKPVAPVAAPASGAAPTVITPTPAPSVAAIDLGGYRSLASLKKSWSDMTERYAEFGTGIEALARLRETDSGMEARLVAGPYSSQEDAAKACLRMRALGVSCAVTGYTGQPLAAIR